MLSVYLLGILFFTAFRLLLIFYNWDYALEIPANLRVSVLFTSFIYGFRFDSVISGYILILPFIILSLFSFFRKSFLLPNRISLIIIISFYAIAFAVESANIPYFKYFFENINSVIFNWAGDYSFTLSMIGKDFNMLLFVFLFVAVLILFSYLVFKLYRISIRKNDHYSISNFKYYFVRGFLFVFFFLVIILAIRGRIEEKSPIRIGTAYFSEYSFANQLGLNPVYTLLASIVEDKKLASEKLHLLDDQAALRNTQTYFNITEDIPPTPISRIASPTEEPTGKNMVLVIMESMASIRIKHFGNANNLTPTMDALINKSVSFDRFFTAGMHTYCGVYATLFSYPTIWNKHPMKPSIIPNLHSIIRELKLNDYHTYFFVAHDDQFDNMGGFLYANGFEKVFGQTDYPSEWILSTLGVPDHILFDEAIRILNERKDDKPFFVSILTASNHDPKIIPEEIDFTPTAEKEDEKIVQYCDWSIKHFLEEASKNNWYSNTIFVFVADHGRSISQPYDMPISFFQSPFIIYNPQDTTNIVQYENFACQLDVMPTIAGLLNISYTNSTLGIDVLKETRPYVYFSNDNFLGVIGSNLFLIESKAGKLGLYDYKSQSVHNLIEQFPEVADSMKTYSHSMQQTSQFIIDNYSILK